MVRQSEQVKQEQRDIREDKAKQVHAVRQEKDRQRRDKLPFITYIHLSKDHKNHPQGGKFVQDAGGKFVQDAGELLLMAGLVMRLMPQVW